MKKEYKHIELNELSLDEHYVLYILSRFFRLTTLGLQNLTSVSAVSTLIGRDIIYKNESGFYTIRVEYEYLIQGFKKLFNVKEV